MPLTPASPKPLTTADIAAFAADHLRSLRTQAASHHATAAANAGSEQAEHQSRCIDTVADWASDAYLLASLAAQHGDDAAAAQIRADVQRTVGELIDLSHTARMLSIPGWDLATRSFKHAVTA